MSRSASSWSARRAAVAAEAEADKKAAEDAVIAQQHAELAEKPDAEVLEELGLPDPDSLKMGDDFKAFMSKAVPEHLRKRALRKLWRSNPVLACVDGLNDYDDDYLTGSTGQGPIKTTYQVGKGMLAHLLEVERQKNALLDGDVAEDVAEEDLVREELLLAEEEADVDAESDPDVTAQAPEDTPEDIAPPAPRRMQFQFEDGTA